MRKSLKKKNLYKFFIVDISDSKKIRVYNRGFYKAADADYAVARHFRDSTTLVVRGVLLKHYPDYQVIPFPGSFLRPSESLVNHPNQEARVRRGRALLKKHPELAVLIPKGESRSAFYNTLARELLTS